MNQATKLLIDSPGTLNERLGSLHARLLETVPVVDRIACALYDAGEDRLKTYLNSTRQGNALAGYEFQMSDSLSLTALAKSGEFRVLDDLDQVVQSSTAHARWLKEQGYRSSFTVPIYDRGALLGFVFFDSVQPAAFLPHVQRDLVLYCSLIGMLLSNEIAAVQTVVESARVARELTGVRDFETGKHLERMARYSRLIARAVAPEAGRSDEFVEHIYLFAPLHDIGKIGIPDSILLKAGALTPSERRIMQGHVEKGMEIIERILGAGGVRGLPDSTILRNIVLCHHEYLDGSGYPRGLRGDEVPLEARIVAVADIYDGLTSVRPYKSVWTSEEAFDELHRLVECGKLDPDCVAALQDQLATVHDIRTRYVDSPAG